jgi:hypothetical protein
MAQKRKYERGGRFASQKGGRWQGNGKTKSFQKKKGKQHRVNEAKWTKECAFDESRYKKPCNLKMRPPQIYVHLCSFRSGLEHS